MPVHLFGQIADMDQHRLHRRRASVCTWSRTPRRRTAARQGDSAAGSFGLGSFSFYATKNITTGEGGIITTNDDAIADRLRILRNQGMRARYEYVMQGHNYRLTDLQAALAIPQIERYPATIDAARDPMRRSSTTASPAFPG